MSKRAVFRIDITEQAVKRFIDLSGTSGVTQIAMASNLVIWFASQPEAVQTAILATKSDAKKVDTSRLVLERMARKDRAKR